MDASFSEHLNFNSVKDLPGFNARAAFTVNSQSVFRKDVDIVPTIVDDSLSYIPWRGDNQMPFDILSLVEKDVIDPWSLSEQCGKRNISHLPKFQRRGLRSVAQQLTAQWCIFRYGWRVRAKTSDRSVGAA